MHRYYCRFELDKIMEVFISFLKKQKNALTKALPLMAFVVPLLWLYLLDAGSFELMWKGRTFQLFFMWLIALELILSWETIQPNKMENLTSAKTLSFLATLLLPTMYVVLANYLGLNSAIVEASQQIGITWSKSMALSTEYLAFAVFFCLMIFLQFGKKGLKDFSVPAFFLGIVGSLYTIDNVFPHGQFTLFQLLVPTTATLAANVLNLIGYQTSLSTASMMPRLIATDPVNPLRTATFDIAWPCAGIESLLIFTIVVLLFLKRLPMSWKAKAAYFAVGASVTYLINIVRIAAIFTIGINGGNVQLFHLYYGPLYSIAWIVSYPLIILGSRSLWFEIAHKRGVKIA
jgi:exosortase/archaeosortase family protein